MDKRELNRDIKRLRGTFKARPLGNTANWTDADWKYSEAHEGVIKSEFIRLYRADDTFKSMNKNSILILLVINRSLRIVPLHTFGISIEL